MSRGREDHASPAHPPSASGPAKPNRDDPLRSGLDKVDRMIAAGRYAYPLASDHLGHWRDGRGRDKNLPASAFIKASFLLEHLNIRHREKFVEGARRRLGTGKLAPGGSVEMEWTDSVNAPYFTDLFYALGGFTVHSKVEAEAETAKSGNGVEVRFVSWKVQVRDDYDWDPGKATFVPGVGRVTDDEMLAIERAGHGRAFHVRSDWVDVTDPRVTAPESFAGGKRAP